ncbi:SPFH domain-containing protein [Thermoflavimicrobium dichotomicum]|uniref:SPFH domain / Band 7 family protein n=1 Tax=Thermoflavimicrobium dichotomicum TaxID=46223 RepID=A0A1I3LG03_9BACL|nr:SPFH domain-containing protein [Thermoflavimicrobium dichotomicum]SFI83460.1 SPFH domain / Band 7 family protein [Thermoflavimicrobium dichotomicum]
MFGIRYLKAKPTQYVLQYKKGKLIRSGKGLSFFYFQRSSTICIVPIGSADTPFIFNEMTADFQPLTIQGQCIYRIIDPECVASMLDYTIGKGNRYTSDDPEKLPKRLINLIQVFIRTEVQKRPLKEAIHASNEISREVMKQCEQNIALSSLGVEIQSITITAIKPTPEMARALEAEAREELLKKQTNRFTNDEMLMSNKNGKSRKMSY